MMHEDPRSVVGLAGWRTMTLAYRRKPWTSSGGRVATRVRLNWPDGREYVVDVIRSGILKRLERMYGAMWEDTGERRQWSFDNAMPVGEVYRVQVEGRTGRHVLIGAFNYGVESAERTPPPAQCGLRAAHVVPDLDCMCGYYAFSHVKSLRQNGAWPGCVIAVSAAGRTVICEKGWRSYRYEIDAIYVPGRKSVPKGMSEQFEVPVFFGDLAQDMLKQVMAQEE